jgi:hypothetical protein
MREMTEVFFTAEHAETAERCTQPQRSSSAEFKILTEFQKSDASEFKPVTGRRERSAVSACSGGEIKFSVPYEMSAFTACAARSASAMIVR